jgi:hypothetical protein
MSPTWQRARAVAFRQSSTLSAPDIRFPRAVRGEAYERFARAMWLQGQRWIRKHSPRVAGVSFSLYDPHEAHDLLRSAATMELGRPLYPQEERLLAELVQTDWPVIARRRAGITPEIPSFLLDPH